MRTPNHTIEDPVLHFATQQAISIPFFQFLDHVLDEVLSAHERTTSGRHSYVIWGGVAANLLLCGLGVCTVHYCFHDIELLFLTKQHTVVHSNKLLCAVETALASDGCPLNVGGRFLSQAMKGRSFHHVRRVRAGLRDGDLLLNTVMLLVDRQSNIVRFEIPAGLLEDILTRHELRMRDDWSDLRSTERIARRISRTIGKSVRFQEVANLNLSEQALEILRRLIEEYLARLRRWDSGEPTAEVSHTAHWLSKLDTDVDSIDAARLWLYRQVIVEVSIRSAGIAGLSSSDAIGLSNFLDAYEGPLNNHLVQNAGEWLMGKHWQPDIYEQAQIRSACRKKFATYQRLGAEKLRTRFSRLSELVKGEE